MPTSNELLALAMGRDPQPLWNFYIVLATAILGVLASGKIGERFAVRAVLAIGFALFAGSNFYAISEMSDQRNVLLDLVTDPSLSRVVESIRPINIAIVGAFHLVVDLVLLVAIVRVSWPTDPPTAASPVSK